MAEKFSDSRLLRLNDDNGFEDEGMRQALLEALEPGEYAVARYSVGARIWVEAVLTDRALVLVKGSVRVKVTRTALPLQVLRVPTGSRKSVRIHTSQGKKTLWDSKIDPEGALLLQAAVEAVRITPRSGGINAVSSDAAATEVADTQSTGVPSRISRREARRLAGPRPRRPRKQRIRRPRLGSSPPEMIFELADNCVKCGRPLTDPRSRKARVGTKCIRIYGSQERRIRNPAHTVWIDKKARAEIAYIAQKSHAEAEYERARTAYEAARREWRRIRGRH